MLAIQLSKRSKKFLSTVHPRHAKQLKTKILSLKNDPYPSDSKKLTGFEFHRVDAGEYRIIYEVNNETLFITLVGKRNDDDVYKKLKRLV